MLRCRGNCDHSDLDFKKPHIVANSKRSKRQTVQQFNHSVSLSLSPDPQGKYSKAGALITQRPLGVENMAVPPARSEES